MLSMVRNTQRWVRERLNWK